MASQLPIIDAPMAQQPSGSAAAELLPATPTGDHLTGLTSPPVPLAERRPLPMSAEEMRERGWDAVDVVFVSGDAYIDHPSFAMAILGRVLEAAGFRVGIVSQPDWRSCADWRRFGRPRLFFAISAGNMDSMINHYTANRKVRNDDAYSPGGRIGRRPDRATLAYCQRAREAYKGVPVIAGGVEASLRRLAHYDYWSEKVRRSILLDSKADRTSNIEHPTSNIEQKDVVRVARVQGETKISADRADAVRRPFDVGRSMLDVRCSSAAPGGPALATLACPTLLLPSYEAIC